MAGYPTASRILFWIVAAGCVGFLAVWLIHWFQRDNRIESLPRPAPSGVGASSEQWLEIARRAAGAGEWPQAVHAVYWAAIVWLQRNGSLPQDLTFTPREFLQFERTRPDAVPSPALAALTRGLERVWYARQTASANDYHESLSQLESLGCKLD